MVIRKFTAKSLPEALTKIKKDFGKEAVILKTHFNSRGNTRGEKERLVEVTAAIENVPVKPTRFQLETTAEQPNGDRILEKKTPKAEEPPAVPEKLSVDKGIGPLPSEILSEIKNEIIRLGNALKQGRERSLFGEPTGLLLELARNLVEMHLPEKTAIEAIRKIPRDILGGIDRKSGQEHIIKNLAGMLSPGEPIKMAEVGATIVMLVGPTGGGKTSAAARLAYHFKKEKECAVSLVTADRFRADSQEQLMSLANVIGCSFSAASSSEELAMLMKTCKEGLVIIDTSGVTTARDMAELTALFGAASPGEVHLVVPADIPSGDISDFLREYPDMAIDKILVTKLDQSRYRGGIVGAAIENGMRFSYQSSSRELPGILGLFDPNIFVSAFKSGWKTKGIRSNPDEVEG